MTTKTRMGLRKNIVKSREILGVNSDSTPKEIKQAYRKLSLKYHPDRNQEFSDGEKFKEVSEAYQFLKSNRKKTFGERERTCLLYTSPSPRDGLLSRMPSSA